MAITTKPLQREFSLNGRKLADPDPNMSVEQVRTFYSGTHPALNNASYTEETTDSAHKVVFTTSVGHKG